MIDVTHRRGGDEVLLVGEEGHLHEGQGQAGQHPHVEHVDGRGGGEFARQPGEPG